MPPQPKRFTVLRAAAWGEGTHVSKGPCREGRQRRRRGAVQSYGQSVCVWGEGGCVTAGGVSGSTREVGIGAWRGPPLWGNEWKYGNTHVIPGAAASWLRELCARTRASGAAGARAWGSPGGTRRGEGREREGPVTSLCGRCAPCLTALSRQGWRESALRGAAGAVKGAQSDHPPPPGGGGAPSVKRLCVGQRALRGGLFGPGQVRVRVWVGGRRRRGRLAAAGQALASVSRHQLR